MSEIIAGDINRGNVAHKKQKMPMLEVRIRNTKKQSDKNFKPSETIHVRAAATLHELKEAVVERLQPSWEKKGVTLKTDNIVVFRVGKDAVGSTYAIVRIVADDERIPLVPTATVESEESEEKKEENTRGAYKFIAVEYFTKLPEDLLRTVRLDQTSPATLASPDHSNQWTSIAPLYCAGLAKSERKLPWYDIKNNGGIKANGVSLRCLDDNETPAPDDAQPFGEIGEQECKGATVMTLERYDELVRIAGDNRDPGFGLLRTKVSHHAKNRCGFGEEKDSVILVEDEGEKKRRKKQNHATARTPYFRFAIRKGLDLAPYGVAVVYDNSSQNHVTLVREGTAANDVDGGDSFREWYDVGFFYHLKGVYLPEDAIEAGLAAKDNDEKFENFLRETPFNLSTSEPEEFLHQTGSTKFSYLPKVASLFALHDLKLVAKAEPSSPEGGFDTYECQLMYEGALALHRLGLCRDLGRDVALAIKALDEANYSITNLDQSISKTLLATLDGKPDIEDAVNLFDVDLKDVQDALDNMQDLLSSHLESKAAENPTP